MRSINIDDQAGAFAIYHAGIVNDLGAAVDAWANFVVSAATFEIEVKFDPSRELAGGASKSNVAVAHHGQYRLVQDSVPFVLDQRNAGKPPPEPPGAVISLPIGPYLTQELWFDDGTGAIPANRTDAYSVFLHELGHALGFNGFLDTKLGSPKQDCVTTYDRYVLRTGDAYTFIGPEAVRVHGGPIPLTRCHRLKIDGHWCNDHHHVGDCSVTNGKLRRDLMNGFEMLSAHRYRISTLDLAILRDVGVQTKNEGQALVL